MENKELLSDYELDSMWMSYRYCIGRHTIASHMRAGDIGKHCYGRLTNERSLFTAYDINREIENQLSFNKNINFNFPATSLNRIYTSAIDIFCQFIEDYNITSKEGLLVYKEINVIPYDNERGYKLEVITWYEWLKAKVFELYKQYYSDGLLTEDNAYSVYERWLEKREEFWNKDLGKEFEKLFNQLPDSRYFFMYDFEDLFVWNDLVHLFDLEHHYWVELNDGTKVECFDTYTNKTEQKENGYLYNIFGYKKIRVPVNEWNGSVTTYIPDEHIKNFNVDPDNI